MDQPDWAGMTVEQAAEVLARAEIAGRQKRAARADLAAYTGQDREKRALGFPEAAGWFRRNNELTHGVLEGAALGGVGGLLGSTFGSDERRKRNPLAAALTGAAVGGTILGGANVLRGGPGEAALPAWMKTQEKRALGMADLQKYTRPIQDWGARQLGGAAPLLNRASQGVQDAAGWYGKQDHMTRDALGGAAIGGLGGLALGATGKRKKNPLSTALTGALAGGAIGLGVGGIRDNLAAPGVAGGPGPKPNADLEGPLKDKARQDYLGENVFARAGDQLAGNAPAGQGAPELIGQTGRAAVKGITSVLDTPRLAAAAILGGHGVGQSIYNTSNKNLIARFQAGAGQILDKGKDTLKEVEGVTPAVKAPPTPRIPMPGEGLGSYSVGTNDPAIPKSPFSGLAPPAPKGNPKFQDRGFMEQRTALERLRTLNEQVANADAARKRWFGRTNRERFTGHNEAAAMIRREQKLPGNNLTNQAIAAEALMGTNRPHTIGPWGTGLRAGARGLGQIGAMYGLSNAQRIWRAATNPEGGE